MMVFKSLIKIVEDTQLPHGTVLRLRGKWPYENIVDFMVVESYDCERGMGLMVSSGYKAGLTLVRLPIESGKYSISSDWLIKNWSYWVYPECPVEDVWVSAGYPAPAALPSSESNHS